MYYPRAGAPACIAGTRPPSDESSERGSEKGCSGASGGKRRIPRSTARRVHSRRESTRKWHVVRPSAAAASHSRRRQLGPRSSRTAAAQLPQQAPCPRSRSGMRMGSSPTHEHLALHLALHLAWAEGAQAPAPVPRQCMDAAQVSSPWRVPSCPRVRGTLSAVGVRSGWRGGKGGRCDLRAISDLLLSHEQRPRSSVHAAQLPQRGLQLPKRHDQTATRGHEHVVSQPRPAAPPTAPRPPLLRRTLAGGMRHRHAAALP